MKTLIVASPSQATVSTNSATFTACPVGGCIPIVANEVRRQFRIPFDGTIRNLRAAALVNGRSTNTTVRTRINGANGNLSVVVPGGSLAAVEDTTNSDTLVAGDLLAFAFTTGTGGGNIALGTIQVEFETASGDTVYFSSYNGRETIDSSVSTNDVLYISPVHAGRPTTFGWANSLGLRATRAFMGAGATVSHLRVNIHQNTLNVACSFEVLKNDLPTGLIVNFGVGVSGAQIDLTNSFAVVAGDSLTIKFDNTGRTSGAIRLGTIELTYTSDDEDWCLFTGSTLAQNPLINGPATDYQTLSTPVSYGTTDIAPNQVKLYTALSVKRLGFVITSGAWSAGNVTIRKNAADTGMVATLVSASVATENFTTGLESFAANDLISLEVNYATASNTAGMDNATTTFGPASADAIGQGPIGTITVSAITGTAETAVVASGNIGTVTMFSPEGGVPTDVVGEGPIGTVTVTPPRQTTPRVTQEGLSVPAVAENELNTTQAGLSAFSLVTAIARITQMGLLVIAKGGETPLVPDPLKLQDGGRQQLLVQRLVNMYVEPTPEGPVATARFQRPGLYSVAELGGGPVRATFLWQGFRFTVSGGLVWRDSVNIGTVPEEGVCRWAISDEEIVIIAGNRAYYVTTEEVSRILDPDLPFVRDVLFLGGRFVYFDLDTGGIYRYSKVNDARSIDGLAFASAEANPDPIIGAVIQGEGMAIFGTQTTEWHYPTLDPDNPFQRSQGRTYDRGCLSIRTASMVDNNIHFVGDNRVVYMAAQSPVKASTARIDDLLRKQTEEEFAQNSAFTVSFGGHEFYVLNIVGQGTWALNVGQKLWAEWKSWGRDRFRVEVCDVDGFMGDAFSGRIMGFDGKKMTDVDGEPIERIISTFQALQSGTMRNFSLALHCQQGVGLLGVEDAEGGDPKVEMRFSDHLGQNWSNWLEGNLGKHGVRGKEALAQWTNLGTFPSPGRAFEFRCTGPVEFTPFMVSINEWRP